MRISQQRLVEQSIHDLYAAASDESHWPAALASLGRVFDSPRVGVLRLTPTFDVLHETRGLNHEAETQRLYNEYFWSHDPSHRITRQTVVGKWLDLPELYDPRTTPEPGYLNDFASQRGMRWIAGGKVHADATSVTILGLQRPVDHKPFDAQGEQAFRRLATHIGRASSLSAELRRAELAHGLSQAALDALESSVYVVSCQAKLLLANRFGDSQCIEGAPFSLRNGSLYSGVPEIRSQIARAIQLGSQGRGCAFRVGLQDKRWLVRTLPVDLHARSVLFYVSPENPAAVGADLLRQLLNFSEAEAEIAHMLADGLTPKEIAYARQVSLNTVRTQVREIFQKAGVRRQADLAKILASVPRVQSRDVSG